MNESIGEPARQSFLRTVTPSKLGISSAATVQSNESVSVSPSSSSAVTVAVPEPGVVGVPDTSRVEVFMVTPSGSPVAV